MESTGIQRIKEIMIFYKLKLAPFASRINVHYNTLNSALKEGQDVKAKILEAILYEFSELDANWLLTGRGKMFTEKPQSFNDTVEATYNVKKPPDKPPCEETEKALLTKDEQVSKLILQSEKLINIIDRHSITIQNLSVLKGPEESPKEKLIIGGNVPKNVQG